MKVSRKYLLLSIVVAVTVLIFLAAQVNAQNQSADDLAQRLKQQGVPVKSVSIVSRVPLSIEITLQSSSNSKAATLDDEWFILLARREATLAYRFGMRIDSYQLRVLNAKGEKIWWVQVYLHPNDLSQKLGMSPPSKVDNATAKRLVTERLQLAGMTLDTLDITLDTIQGSTGQILLIQLSVPDLDAANRSLPLFMDSLRRMLDTINSEQGTGLILCRLKLVDRRGQVLFHFAQDVETGQRQASGVKGLAEGWYLHRGPMKLTEPIPTATPRPYP